MKAEFTISYTFLLEAPTKEQIIINRDLLLSCISDARAEADNAGYGTLLRGVDSAIKYEGETVCRSCGK